MNLRSLIELLSGESGINGEARRFPASFARMSGIFSPSLLISGMLSMSAGWVHRAEYSGAHVKTSTTPLLSLSKPSIWSITRA